LRKSQNGCRYSWNICVALQCCLNYLRLMLKVCLFSTFICSFIPLNQYNENFHNHFNSTLLSVSVLIFRYWLKPMDDNSEVALIGIFWLHLLYAFILIILRCQKNRRKTWSLIYVWCYTNSWRRCRYFCNGIRVQPIKKLLLLPIKKKSEFSSKSSNFARSLV
jgi:hypothetical protein